VKQLLLFFSSILSLSIVLSTHVSAQSGGSGVYEFLNMPNSARLASMGGNFLAVNDDDITTALANPSLINENMSNSLGLSFVDYFTDVNYGFAQYGRSWEKAGSFVGTLQYINYGKFQEANEAGVIYGEFNANEMALNIGWGRRLAPRWSIGANGKLIYSSLASYSSFGIAVDIAGSYINDDKNFVASLIARNIGYQIVAYNNGNNEPLPFELQIGLSQKLKHLPFRYSVVLQHLEKWNLRYDNPDDPSASVDPFTGDYNEPSDIEKFADNLMRHIVIGGEILIGKNLSLRAGYNYLRRQELKLESKPAMVGFSFGFGLRISKFHFSYARSTYHLVGSPNYFTLTFNLNEFSKKRVGKGEM